MNSKIDSTLKLPRRSAVLKKVYSLRSSVYRMLICLLVTGITLTGTVTAYAENAEEKLPSGISYSDISDRIEKFSAEHADTTAAMAVSVFDKDGVIYKNNFGYTDVKNQIPADEESVFEWGSVTKTTVWISVMQLWEQGLIDLNADIRTYIPDGFLTNLNYDEPITMFNLMNHNAGFQEVLSDLFMKDYDGSSLEEALSHNQPQQIYEPGKVTAYSNWSSALAGYIVERVSGLPFGDYVHKNIFDKLGMEHTAILPDLSDNMWVKTQREKLQCYTVSGDSLGNLLYSIPLYPAGMCTGTLDDFQTYAKALIEQKSGILFENESTYKQLFSATSYYGDTNIARNCHGFWTLEFGVSTIGHGGNTAGCSSYLLLDLHSGIGMVVMTNQSSEEIYNSIMPELIFGKFSDSDKYSENLNEKSNLSDEMYRAARTITQGPLSFYSMSFIKFDENLDDSFLVRENKDGIEKIALPYGDYLKLTAKDYIPPIILLILLAVSVVYAVITCIVDGCIIRPIRKRILKSRGSEPKTALLSKWNYIACAAIIMWIINFAVVVIQLFTYSQSSHYVWQFAVFGIIALAMCVMVVIFVVLQFKEKSALKTKVKCWFTVTALIVTVISTVVWELYNFWSL